MRLTAIERFTLLDYPGKVACIAFTPGCDLRCGFCHNAEFVLPERLAALAESFIAEEHFFQFLAKRQGLLEGVVVSGGEPTVWQELPEFLARIKALGFAVKLDTNGNNPQMVDRLIKEELVDYIAMDVKTTLEKYRELTGPGAKPENIEKSISLIRQSHVNHEFRTTLIREHHTDEIIQGLSGLLSGVKQVYLQTFRPGQTLLPLFAGYHGFDPAEMEVIAESLRTAGRQVGVRV